MVVAWGLGVVMGVVGTLRLEEKVLSAAAQNFAAPYGNGMQRPRPGQPPAAPAYFTPPQPAYQAPQPQPVQLAPLYVVDGDGLIIGDREFRLLGIDAPESAQSCIDGSGAPWPCGQAATQQMAQWVAMGPVYCQPNGDRTYDREVATCTVTAGGQTFDLGKSMVQAGLAVAYRRYSMAYAADEEAACAAGKGIWSGRFDEPWRWRKGQRQPTNIACGPRE